MRLDCLISNPKEKPIIRLYDFGDEVQVLHAAVSQVANGSVERIVVQELPGIEAIDDCELALRIRKWDQAIVRGRGPKQFECGFTLATWDNIAGLIEPFLKGSSGFQWLATTPGEALLLLSPSGDW